LYMRFVGYIWCIVLEFLWVLGVLDCFGIWVTWCHYKKIGNLSAP